MEDEVVLDNLASSVVLKMQQIPQLSGLPISELEAIPLG